MNKFFFIEPEVAGGLGEHTVMNQSTHPPKVSRLVKTLLKHLRLRLPKVIKARYLSSVLTRCGIVWRMALGFVLRKSTNLTRTMMCT